MHFVCMIRVRGAQNRTLDGCSLACTTKPRRRAGAIETMAATLARTLAGVALVLATTARGFVAPAAMTRGLPPTAPTSAASTRCCAQQRQQRLAFAPTPALAAAGAAPSSSFLGRARSLDRLPSAGAGRRRLRVAGVAGAGRECGVTGGGGGGAARTSTATTTMGLGFLAPGGGRRLAFAALANAAAFATVGGACGRQFRLHVHIPLCQMYAWTPFPINDRL